MPEIQEIQFIIDKIINKFSPEKIMLFGSRAIGKNGAESDYDILVLKSNLSNKRNFVFDLYRLIGNEPFAIDFVVDTPENFEKNSSNQFMIYKNIKNEGKVIYERQ